MAKNLIMVKIEIMDKIFNYWWTFESWVKFWIMGVIFIHGWTFQSWVNFLLMNKFLYCLQTFYSWVKFWIMGNIFEYLWIFQSWVNNNCDLLFCSINFKRSVVLLHLSWKDHQYFIFNYGWIFFVYFWIMVEIWTMGELLNKR